MVVALGYARGLEYYVNTDEDEARDGNPESRRNHSGRSIKTLVYPHYGEESGDQIETTQQIASVERHFYLRRDGNDNRHKGERSKYDGHGIQGFQIRFHSVDESRAIESMLWCRLLVLYQR